MQMEGIIALNIYGTPQEPLCKMYTFWLSSVVCKIDGGGEEINIFFMIFVPSAVANL